MQSAIFKIYSRADDTEGISSVMQEADIIFAKDENGEQIEGCFWNILHRMDENFIKVGVKTIESVMAILLQYPGTVEITVDDIVETHPRVELMQKLEGWPEEVLELEIIE